MTSSENLKEKKKSLNFRSFTDHPELLLMEGE
jgi:hypothetical protein